MACCFVSPPEVAARTASVSVAPMSIECFATWCLICLNHETGFARKDVRSNQDGRVYAMSSAGAPAPPTATTRYCLPLSM